MYLYFCVFFSTCLGAFYAFMIVASREKAGKECNKWDTNWATTSGHKDALLIHYISNAFICMNTIFSNKQFDHSENSTLPTIRGFSQSFEPCESFLLERNKTNTPRQNFGTVVASVSSFENHFFYCHLSVMKRWALMDTGNSSQPT